MDFILPQIAEKSALIHVICGEMIFITCFFGAVFCIILIATKTCLRRIFVWVVKKLRLIWENFYEKN
jgi:hypothetical protein